MINQYCAELVKRYLAWLSDSFRFSIEENHCVIETPFSLPDNDPIKLWIRSLNNNVIRLSDNGTVLDYLFFGGVNIERIKNDVFVTDILSPRKIDWQYDDLRLDCKVNEFEESFHYMVTAIIELTKVVVTVTPKEIELPFRMEVKEFLDRNNFLYKFQQNIQGKAKEHKIDFIFNTRGHKLLETVSATKPHRALEVSEITALKFLDLKAGGKDFLGIVTFDDNKDVWSPDSLAVLSAYSNQLFAWSDKSRLLDLLRVS